jgi:hypothetical protein
MAKKKSRRGSFNMSAAVRDILRENPNLTGKEVEAELKQRHPGQKINSNSLSVAFSGARQKLGITKKKRSVKRRRPSAGGARANGSVDISVLQKARKYVAEVGDVDMAEEAIKQLKTVQLGLS